jgi:hypothetical protein
MDILRNLFGNLTSGIVRLAVTAGILFLCYLFIVKPVLKTTNDAIEASGLDRVSKSLRDLGPKIEREVKHSFRAAKAHGDPQHLIRCVKRAKQDIKRIERCTRRF